MVTELLWLNPRELVADAQNVRASDDELALEGLAASIREHGVLQPIGVARGEGGYRVVYGSRRRHAAIAAGLDVVPCVEVTGSDDDRFVKQLVENLQRRELNDLEKAEGFARLRRTIAARRAGNGHSPDQDVADALGLSVRTIQRYLGLRELATPVRDLIANGDLTVTQAQHLRAIADGDQQFAVARLVAERSLSAATTSRLCQALARQPGLSPETALAAMESGLELEDIRGRPSGRDTAKSGSRAPSKAPTTAAVEDDAGLWEDDADASGPDDDGFPMPPRTADGHRRFKIRTVDAFCDEVDRLARCLQDGDLGTAAAREGEARTRLGLAARQLTFVSRELADFLRGRGWE
ncbi:MAG: ParB/RepB/Spo0J family partition protein [Chloroflexi bacterium]|nr:ParB/RepB/Spo0J family partition protein [Chloroflexota bacterium]